MFKDGKHFFRTIPTPLAERPSSFLDLNKITKTFPNTIIPGIVIIIDCCHHHHRAVSIKFPVNEGPFFRADDALPWLTPFPQIFLQSSQDVFHPFTVFYYLFAFTYSFKSLSLTIPTLLTPHVAASHLPDDAPFLPPLPSTFVHLLKSFCYCLNSQRQQYFNQQETVFKLSGFPIM